MNRIASGLCVAAAFTFAASLGAQTPTTSATGTTMSHDQDVVVTGCLQRDADGNYMLTNAIMDTSMTRGGTSTTGTTGSSTTAGTSAMGSSANAMAASTWVLEGGTDLDKHVGHKIQVTGRQIESKKDEASTTAGATGATATTGTTGTTGSRTTTGQKLDVKSVKMISSSCS